MTEQQARVIKRNVHYGGTEGGIGVKLGDITGRKLR